VVGLAKRALQERCYGKTLTHRQKVPTAALCPVSSFDDNPAVLHVFNLQIPPVERYVKIPMSDATLLSIKGSAPGI
jgi:hypothetical protein